MASSDVDVVRRAWEAFARGDVDAAARRLDPQVRWYGAGDPGADGACHSRRDVEAAVRGLLAAGATADLLDVRDAGERVVVLLQRRLPAGSQAAPPPHGELVTVRDGRITEMVSYPTVEEALAAAGLGPA